MNNSNPLIESDILDTLGNVENHLRFINARICKVKTGKQ